LLVGLENSADRFDLGNWTRRFVLPSTPWFFFTTDDARRINADDDPMEFPSQAVAIQEAHHALRDMARDYDHRRSGAVLSVTVLDENGAEVYRASMTFDGSSI
jgi:hypothetical protein